jgi:hypothetical protein
MDDDPEVSLVRCEQFVGIEAAFKDQNRLSDASLAKLKGFGGKGHGKAVCAIR